jgi:hypothetical protein
MIRLRWFNLRPHFPGYSAHLVVRLWPVGAPRSTPPWRGRSRRVWRAWSRRQPRPNGNATDAVQAALEVQQ